MSLREPRLVGGQSNLGRKGKMMRLLCKACPEHHEILCGVYPERDSSVASLPQNDKKQGC